MFFLEKDNRISGRYITFEMIQKSLKDYQHWKMPLEGKSVEGTPIELYRIGSGKKRILIWSQMHGNESTTTLAMLDILLYISQKQPDFLQLCTIFFIPMLNPDGAKKYTRLNAISVDLNRDAQQLTQPESQFLRSVFEQFNPDFCFNLHGQRTIFGAGKTGKPAIISFLAPSVNPQKEITSVRKKAMEIISIINNELQKIIPNCIGRYNDDFNINCTGDMFMSLNVPTLLFEAGHFAQDYSREQVRKYVALAILKGIEAIAYDENQKINYEEYFKIPQNETCFRDIFIENNSENIAVYFEEKLENSQFILEPKITEIGKLEDLFGHQTISLSDIYDKKFINCEEVKNQIIKNIKTKILGQN